LITILCGGVGGSRFLTALSLVLPPQRITAIVNTGDDEEFHGLYVSPDPDICTYALAGEVDEAKGWGLRGDTFRWLEHIARFGRETWFQIGDRDLATHLHRTRLLREGWTLSAVAGDIARAFGVRARLLPMSDDRVRTVVETDVGDLPFQDYLVRRHARDVVRGVRYEGADVATPAPGVMEAIADAEAIFIAPSNPIGSIGPMLAMPPLREALAARASDTVAMTPIVGGASLQPPADAMLSGLGYAVDVSGVAAVYQGFIGGMIIDTADADAGAALEARGLRVLPTDTVMRDTNVKRSLATAALEFAGVTV
jgi:LPPG:FO 2-phospho-L-lactate transferase